MAADEFEEVNKNEEREIAREQRGARLRAMWRAHPVLFTIGALLALYAFALIDLILRPRHLRGSSVFLWAGIVAVAGFVFLMLRLWSQRRVRRTQSDWT
jgi:hypothetical protein